MPTLLEPHEQRQMAESFGVDADRYDRARPRYPAALIDRIVATAPGREVLDVGVGTGIAARQLRDAGCRVLGVDVDARMAEVARRHGIEAEVARFEEWAGDGRSFDAVVAGQTWHWIDPAAGARRAAAVLRPGGVIAVFWNAFQPTTELAEALTGAHQEALPDLPDLPVNPWAAAAGDPYGQITARAADGLRGTDAFTGPQEWRFEWDHDYTRDEWLDVVPTTGLYTRLPAEPLQRLLDRTGAAIDALGGRFTLHYTTVAIVAKRI
ncbi:class I SAM-dependent methyltransferase [Actinoplanes sp. NPDC051633]|uniref:class I SAM-dependent methyltransferase n=1 Tax=Actinoplanes sp. NPDC051633 TaxID=3155670 RepID=UPI0034261D3A